MNMRRIQNIKEYFKSKSKIEVERKALEIDSEKIKDKLIHQLNALLVCKSIVTSRYYYSNIEEIDEKYDIIEQAKKSFPKDREFWLRLRTMRHQESFLYFVETKHLIGDKKEKLEIGNIVDEKTFRIFEILFQQQLNIEPRETEIKVRRTYVLPDDKNEYFEGLEYSLDFPYEPIHIPPFLEVEACKFELFLEGIEKIGLERSEFSDISTKKLYKIYREFRGTRDRIPLNEIEWLKEKLYAEKLPLNTVKDEYVEFLKLPKKDD